MAEFDANNDANKWFFLDHLIDFGTAITFLTDSVDINCHWQWRERVKLLSIDYDVFLRKRSIFTKNICEIVCPVCNHSLAVCSGILNETQLIKTSLKLCFAQWTVGHNKSISMKYHIRKVRYFFTIAKLYVTVTFRSRIILN